MSQTHGRPICNVERRVCCCGRVLASCYCDSPQHRSVTIFPCRCAPQMPPNTDRRREYTR